jgi:outer membrane protein TolC
VQEQARLTRIENRESPQIGVQGINEKQPGTRWDTRFGIVVHFPFASEARNAPRRAEAEQRVTEALVRLELTRRRVAAAVRQAGIVLAGAEQEAAAASRAAADLDRRSGQVERAWRLGEMDLIEVIRADSTAFDADLARDKAQTELDAARQRVGLAEGVLP